MVRRNVRNLRAPDRHEFEAENVVPMLVGGGRRMSSNILREMVGYLDSDGRVGGFAKRDFGRPHGGPFPVARLNSAEALLQRARADFLLPWEVMPPSIQSARSRAACRSGISNRPHNDVR